MRFRAIPLLLSLGLLLALAPPGQAQEPAPVRTPAVSSQRMERVGGLGGLVSAATTDGVTALVAEGESLLRLDVSAEGDGSLPVVASVNLERGVIQDVVEAFPITYALTEEGLVVMQGVSDAVLPQVVAFVPGGGQAMALGGEAVYVAARDAGLRVIDVSVPQQARLLSALPLPGPAGDVALHAEAGLVLVAAGEAGLHVVDVQDPAQPALLVTLDDITPVDSVAVANSALGPVAYVGSGGRLLAVALPDAAQVGDTPIVGVYEPLRDGRRLVVSPGGDFGYVADGDGGLKIYDLASPDQLLQVYADPYAEGVVRGPALAVAVSSDEDLAAVASGEGGLRILDVSNPYGPVERFVVALPGPAEGVAFSADGGQAFVTLGEGGLALVDVTTAAVLGVVPLPGRALDVAVDRRWVYVTLGEAGLVVLRVDSPGQAEVLATLALPGEALGLTRLGDTLFVAVGEEGLVAVDVLRPAEPRVVGQIVPDTAGGRYEDVRVIGKRAFVADGEGVAIIDVADPARMVHLTRRDAADALALALSEQGIDVFLYLLSPAHIASYEVSISTEPVLLGTYRPIERVGRVVSHADQLLLTNAGDGPQVVVLNVSNPRLPREVGWHGDAGHSLDAAAHDGTVLVAGGLEGLSRLAFDEDARLRAGGAYNPLPDLTRVAAQWAAGDDPWAVVGGGQGWSLVAGGDPANLRPLSRAGEGLRVRDLVRDGAQVVVVAGQQLLSFDVSDPENPVLAHQGAISGLVQGGLALNDRYVFVADSAHGAGGLEIFTRDELRPVTRVLLPVGANGMALDPAGALAYAALEDGSLALVDVTEPTGGLRSLGTLPLSAPAALAPGPEPGRALALAGRELSLLDAGRPADLLQLDQGRLRQPGRDIVLAGDQLSALTAEGELALYDLSLVGNPGFAGALPADAEAMVAGPAGVLYLARGEAGLGMLALADEALTVVDASPNAAYALLLDGDVLYAAGTRLVRYDVSAAPAGTPREVASVGLSGPARGVALAGVGTGGTRWLYVSTVNGIDVVRDDGPAGALELVAQVPVPSGVRQVIGGGNRAYAALVSPEGGLLVLGTSNLGEPVPLFTYRSPMGASVQEMLLLGERLLVSWEGGLELLDAGNPASPPALLDTLPTGGGRALDVTLAGGRAYVSLGQDGIAIFDVSRAPEVALLGMLDTPGLASHAAASDETLFVADGSCGVRAVDVSDPRAPQERGFWQTGFTADVALSEDGIVYAANGNELLALRYLPDAPPEPPAVPRDPTPVYGEADVDTAVQLGWGPPADPCNPLRYEVWLGVSESPPLLGQVAGEPGLDPGGLRGLTTYHWQVRAIDAQGDVAEGPPWSFTTGRGGLGALTTPGGPPFFLNWLQGVGWLPLVVAGGLALGLLALRRVRRRS